jgi:hypothetical protein
MPTEPWDQNSVTAPHLAGWDRDGRPIYRGTESEWRAMWRRLVRERGARRSKPAEVRPIPPEPSRQAHPMAPGQLIPPW